jgi:hypothetical protein
MTARVLTNAPRIVIPVGIALGLVAEWTALRRPDFAQPADAAELRLAAADLVVGVVLIACGWACSSRRPESRVGLLLAAAGFAWFLGTFATSTLESAADVGALFVTLHRGPLVHALIAYPTGRCSDRLERIVVAAGYVSAVVADLGESPWVMLGLAAVLVGTRATTFRRARGPMRRARRVALAAALAFAAVLAAAAVASLAESGAGTDRALLWAYQAAIVAIAVALTVDLLRGGWSAATVTGLVVELGEVSEGATLRGALARALGDPSLVVGYWDEEEGAYFDERGDRVELPEQGSRRQVTELRDLGRPLAALVHEPASLEDPKLAESVLAAVRIAVSNIALQREIRRRIGELDASRRRLVEAADLQRRQLEQRVRDGAASRLEQVEEILMGAEDEGADAAVLAGVLAELGAAGAELGEFAQGVRPRLLTEQGLAAALADLVQRGGVPVELRVAQTRWAPAVEAAAYFVCAEALANIGKHAPSARATIEVAQSGARLIVIVADDGDGGASLDAGSGLRGLADRVEALGGQFTVTSPPGEGTTVVAELPPPGRERQSPILRQGWAV